ncbi:hypothetical protein [uncultured Paludibaculum sp.]|uniref:hypothetical protein n=1 Tax=uncultured Paludibaculum sp. TaxID=1765020 RepID=UPI002AAA69CF|nr:hypothetical protein [uncultured Paludibaculum sp.]
MDLGACGDKLEIKVRQSVEGAKPQSVEDLALTPPTQAMFAMPQLPLNVKWIVVILSGDSVISSSAIE